MKKIFFLDDDKELLDLMVLLTETCCKSSAVSCDSLEDVVRSSDQVLNTNMAFLDINLGPQKPSGLEVYRWLRKQGYQKPIYFLTGHGANAPEVIEAKALGAVRVLTKPLPTHDLQSLIKDAE